MSLRSSFLKLILYFWDIFLIIWACFQTSYLTFIASYQNKKEKIKAIAKKGEYIPYLRPIKVVILLEMLLWTEGNQPHLTKKSKLNFFSSKMSKKIFIN
jgi:hypothetical protein